MVTMANWLLGICFVTMVMTTVKAQTMSLEGCGGMTKGCFQSPAGCEPDTCDFFLSWEVNGDGNNVFDMTGDAIAFVAVGFSKSGLMADSDVYACTSNSEVVRSRNTVGNTNDASQPLKGVSDVTVSAVSGRLKCRFTRQTSLSDGDSTYYDLSGSNEYYLIMSKSSTGLSGINIEYHSGGKVIGPQSQFTQFGSSTPPPTQGIITTDRSPRPTQPTTQDACGTTIGCFEFPPGCAGPDTCDFYLTWTLDSNGDNIFDMSGAATSYVAVGFSKSGKMADSDVYACTSNNEVVRSRNTMGNTNDASQPLKGVSAVTFTNINGRLRCQFMRQAKRVGDNTYYDLSSGSYTIIMSRSSAALAADGNIQYHFDGRTFAGSPTDFTAFKAAKAGSDNTRQLKKSHGSLMIIAWMGFASIAITIARYFKKIMPGTKIFDKPVWFQVHRTSMITVFCLTIAAFVIIFVSVGGFVERGMDEFSHRVFAHGIMGTIVTFLAILNPIMAIFRPHPGEPNRPIFNYAHRTVGLSAHIIGLVCIVLALGPGNTRPFIGGTTSYTFWIMVVFLAFHVLFWIGLEIWTCSKTESKKSGDIPMSDNNGDNNASTDQIAANDGPSEKESTVMNMLFFTYLTIAVIFTLIILIVVIAS